LIVFDQLSEHFNHHQLEDVAHFSHWVICIHQTLQVRQSLVLSNMEQQQERVALR
jgi:hypothetical protein